MIWFVATGGDNGRGTTSPTTVTAPATTPAASADPTTVAASAAPAVVAEATTAVPQPPASPAFIPPPIPATPVYAGAGVAYTTADPLPSGLTFAEVQQSLTVSQLVADLLAADQWESARLSLYFEVNGETKTPTVAALRALWGTADRISLVLLDAQKDAQGAGYDLLVGAIVNLHDGTTTVQCNHLYTETNPPAVVDLGNASVISEGEAAFMPEEFLNDSSRISDLRTRCV